MHWLVYPSPTSQNSKTNEQAHHNLKPRVVKTVGVTGKILKWLLEKLLLSILLQIASVRGISMRGKPSIRELFRLMIASKNCKVNKYRPAFICFAYCCQVGLALLGYVPREIEDFVVPVQSLLFLIFNLGFYYSVGIIHFRYHSNNCQMQARKKANKWSMHPVTNHNLY